jgi:hypothetical protein
MNTLADWECYLLPASLLAGVDRLPLHEACRSRLEHVRIPHNADAIRQELGARGVCAVSWRWSGLPSPAATFAELAEWSPMSDLQLARLKDAVARSRSSYVWIDWTCVPQLADDTMAFINATYDIYSLSPTAVFLPRIHPFPRRGWPALSPDAADYAVEVVRTVAKGVVDTGSFSPAFKRIIRDAARAEHLEEKLSVLAGRTENVSRQVESVLQILRSLLGGEAVAFPSFDYYTRAWTLAERLAVFKPSRESPIRIGDLHSAGDAFLYTLSSFWRDVDRHACAYVREGRPSLSLADLVFAVHVRGVDPSEVEAEERWGDMNRIVQLSPGTVGLGSENAALAVICVEWLLHEATGTADETGMVAATLLGECVAFASIAVATATLQEEATPAWFRKYLHFQAGSVYGSTIPADLILAVYRSCGLAERATAEDAVESSLLEVFGDEPAGGIEILCREALRHDDVHTHIWTQGTGEEPLAATDFVPMLPARSRTPLDAGSWTRWMTETGLLVSWWFSNPDQTLPVDPTAVIDIEHLYCGDVSLLHGLSLDRVLRSTVTVVYKIVRQDDRRWRLLQLSFSRRDGRCGGGLSPFRISRGLELEPLLGRDILRDGRAAADLIEAWNGRLLESLDAGLHPVWNQCPFSAGIGVVS